jgi:hypothetical protein
MYILLQNFDINNYLRLTKFNRHYSDVLRGNQLLSGKIKIFFLLILDYEKNIV